MSPVYALNIFRVELFVYLLFIARTRRSYSVSLNRFNLICVCPDTQVFKLSQQTLSFIAVHASRLGPIYLLGLDLIG
jgi:hypothetical protein